MNLLIIAGLLALALVAILVAVLLSISEQQAEKTRKQDTITPSTSAPASTAPVEAGNTPNRTALSATTQKDVLVDTDEQILPLLNGQFREFASELRSLQQQASELEQRLRGMTEMVDRIENTRANHISIEEDTHTRSQADNL